ncbi:MAG: vitamin K epoxide reductase family protein, partial [Chlamydiae bacterium]|nr:vitamin K epoxide reductase family protein [Chlamydiota bacterium]
MKEKIAQHERHLYCFFGVIFLGFWLIFSPNTFGYQSEAMRINDQIIGLILMLFGLTSLSSRWIFAPWVLTIAGLWLGFAPLAFWAPDAVSYLNNTLVSIFVILLSIIIPGIPGAVEEKGKKLPLGWSYNPSSWQQRIPVIICASIGWFIARYLASYQLGYIDEVWDPFFGNGTYKVLTSSIAKFFPVSDAGLGAYAYSLEFLMGLKGGENRWRTMPWMCVLFAILVVPLGVVSILLIISQPLLIHTWCGLCLITGFCMLVMIIFTIDEMVAVIQFLHIARKRGLGFWKTFFCGGSLPDLQEDTKTPSFHGHFKAQFPAMLKGAHLEWNLVLSILIGIYLMFTPHFIIGALTIVVSMISLAEVSRSLRFINVLLGTILLFFFKMDLAV